MALGKCIRIKGTETCKLRVIVTQVTIQALDAVVELTNIIPSCTATAIFVNDILIRSMKEGNWGDCLEAANE